MGCPVKGQYFENITPVTGKVFCEVARGTAEDIELALDAAHKVAPPGARPRSPNVPPS
ncbi:aldehyde dehydrogenase [Arthrobacter sp. Hiyo4]|nr:aldehyde dehydrogenase [Arthrobacter sp. Hiyo4]